MNADEPRTGLSLEFHHRPLESATVTFSKESSYVNAERPTGDLRQGPPHYSLDSLGSDGTYLPCGRCPQADRRPCNGRNIRQGRLRSMVPIFHRHPGSVVCYLPAASPLRFLRSSCVGCGDDWSDHRATNSAGTLPR